MRGSSAAFSASSAAAAASTPRFCSARASASCASSRARTVAERFCDLLPSARSSDVRGVRRFALVHRHIGETPCREIGSSGGHAFQAMVRGLSVGDLPLCEIRQRDGDIGLRK